MIRTQCLRVLMWPGICSEPPGIPEKSFPSPQAMTQQWRKWQAVSSPRRKVFTEIHYMHLLTVSLEKAFINLLNLGWSITFNWLCWALIVKIGWKTKKHGAVKTPRPVSASWVKRTIFTQCISHWVPSGNWPQRSLLEVITQPEHNYYFTVLSASSHTSCICWPVET